MSWSRLARMLAGWLLAASLSPSPCLAVPGFYLEEELVKSAPDASPERETIRTWLVPGKMYKEQGVSGSVTIFRDDRRLLWVLDPRRKTYFVLTREALDQAGQLGLSALAGTQDEDPGGWLKKTGNQRKIGPWQAYEVRAEDRPLPGTRVSLWLSTDVPIDRALRDQFGSSTLGSSSPAGRLLAGLRQLDGYPVEVHMTVRLGAQILEFRQTLKKVEKVDEPDARFELPAGYAEVASPLEALDGEAPRAPASR